MTAESVEEIEDIRADWIRLADAAEHPFATWEWSSGWWRHLGAGRTPHTVVCRGAEGQAVAILPLYLDRVGPLRVARFAGDGDLRGPVCAPEDRSVAAAGLREAIQPGRGRASVLLAERLPSEGGWQALLGGRRVATHPDPVLPLKGVTWEELLKARSRNFRQQVRRRERRLVEEHGLSFRLSTDPADLDRDMEALFRLHAMRWAGETSGVFEGARREFQREFAAAAQRRGWLRLWIAEIDGEAVAAWYGWRFANSEWYYQAGRDPRFDRLSLGFVLLAHTVREACADGVDAYRFLYGGEAYKWRFASADLSSESLVLGRGPAGRLGALGLAAAVPPALAVRRRLRASGGRRVNPDKLKGS